MSRFIDVDLTNKDLDPVDGYLAQPLVSLEKSLRRIVPLVDQLGRYIKVAKKKCHYPNEHGLTIDQSAAIYLYTMEWGDGSFYRVLNRALRSEDRHTLISWFSFLKLFHTALEKLPLIKQGIWRGLREDVSAMYVQGLELTWWSVSSCSLAVNVIKNFLGLDSTLFLIEATSGRSVSGYSSYENENEVILPPGTRLRVESNALDHDGGLHIVHLREINEEPSPPSAPPRCCTKKKILLTVGLIVLANFVIWAIIIAANLSTRQGPMRYTTETTTEVYTLQESTTVWLDERRNKGEFKNGTTDGQDIQVRTEISCYTCGNTSCTDHWWRYPERRQRKNGQMCFVEVKYDYLSSYRYLKHVKAGAQNGTACHPFNTKDYYWYCCSSDDCNEQWIAQWVSRPVG